MGLEATRTLGAACGGVLLAVCIGVAPGCSKTVVEIINAPDDASVGRDASSMSEAGTSPDGSGGDGAPFDATLGTEAGAEDAHAEAPDAEAPDADLSPDGQGGFVGLDGAVDSGVACPGPDLRCHVDTCDGHATSISGKVFDPAGVNPIPHAFVFAPSDPAGAIPAITPGATSCDTCDLPIGSYVTATMTDATGSFSLTGVPTGTHVPIVIQLGKWRREVFVSTTACADTALPAADTHLPSIQAEGDMPAMALLTGGSDDLGCLLARFGIGSGEFSSPHAGGRLDVYQGFGIVGNGPGLSTGTAGNCTNTSCPLWSSKASLESYDIVLLACEGNTYDGASDAGVGGGSTNVTATGKAAMHAWLGEGGKVFATHYQYTWFMNGPADFQGVATWLGASVGSGEGTYGINTAFAKGADFRTELADAGVIGSGNSLALAGVGTSVSSVNAPTLAWIKDPSTQDAKYLTFTTPVGGTCGKAAFSDVHAGNSPSGNVPGACTLGALSAEEKALELLFFDLSACVSDDSKAPPGPPPSGG
jgi:hypothetical protein